MGPYGLQVVLGWILTLGPGEGGASTGRCGEQAGLLLKQARARFKGALVRGLVLKGDCDIPFLPVIQEPGGDGVCGCTR